MALGVLLIVAVFLAAFAYGRAHRPRPRTVGPAGPVPVQPAAVAQPTITAPGAAPPLPALKVFRPAVRGRAAGALGGI